MNASTSILARETLSDSQRTALIRLLGDEDPQVFQQIYDTIAAQGAEALEWLAPYELSDDPRIRRRVRGLRRKLAGQEADTVFLSFCLSQGDQLNIEDGLLLLSRASHPEINLEGYRALLDAYAEEVRLRIAGVRNPRCVLGTINRVLFEHLGFYGRSEDYHDTQSSYLSRVMDRRRGNPISLCAVYLLICHRLNLPVVGVGMPGHFLCRYQCPDDEIYIDVFNRGRFMTRTDCIHRLVRSNWNLRDKYLAPISPGKMLLRTVNNLHQIYQQKAERNTSLRMRTYLLALAKGVHTSGRHASKSR